MRKLLALLLLSIGLAPALRAQTPRYPDRPVTIVVPFAPGGSSDAISRIVAQELALKWKQPVVIDNRAGGQTLIGSSFVARAPADGYTILYVGYSWTINPLLMKTMPFNPADFAPLTLLGRYPLALYVRGDLPVQNLAEFVAYAKKAGKPLSIGNAGVGTSAHLAGVEFAEATGLKIVSVAYKAGTIGAINDLIGGQIDAVFEGRTFKQHVDSKRLKALMLAQPGRMTNWQELPSAADVGYPTLDTAGYFGLMVSARTPKTVQEQLYADVAEVLRSEQVQQRLLDVGLQPSAMTPAQFADFLKGQHEKLGGLVSRHRDQMTE
jgi:tripartite-type tricarboxylate transporter receptor subunit TctC